MALFDQWMILSVGKKLTGETKRWIKDLPSLHLAFVLLWLYFSIYQPSWLSISGLVVVGVLAVHYIKGRSRTCFCNLCLTFLSFSEYRIISTSRKSAPIHLRLIPDSIKDGDALSFVLSGRTYSTLKIRKKQQWQGESKLICWS